MENSAENPQSTAILGNPTDHCVDLAATQHEKQFKCKFCP
jgi:hypothetical protein